jgi:hypothetical protein
MPFFGILLALLTGSLSAQELKVRVSSGGAPAVARVYITGADGKAYRIPGAPGYSRRTEVHSLVNAEAALRLPPGRYTVRAEKGCEFGAIERSVELLPGAASKVELEVPRFHDMNRRGWYSGDMHIHRDPGEMELILRAEELNVAPVITRHVGGPRTTVPAVPRIPSLRVGPAQVASFDNQEVERLRTGYGAVLLLNTPRPVPDRLHDLFPLDVEFCKQAKAQGGFVDAEKPIWKNVPVNVALGAIDAIGVVNNHFHPRDVLLDAESWGSMERVDPAYKTKAGFAQWMIDLYYSFLNCGFRLPVSAGSASGVMPSWPGYERVYVYLGAEFDYSAWFAALKAGRSFATNGPLLEVSVEGKPPGAEFDWTKARSTRIEIDARTQGLLERVEVVFNGQVIRTFRPDRGDLRTTVSLSIPGPGWLAVRCFEPVASSVRYAHTSPFYFTDKGKLPVGRADAERWAEFLNRLAKSLQPADFPSPEAFHETQATIGKAESIYRELQGRGQSGVSTGPR